MALGEKGDEKGAGRRWFVGLRKLEGRYACTHWAFTLVWSLKADAWRRLRNAHLSPNNSTYTRDGNYSEKL